MLLGTGVITSAAIERQMRPGSVDFPWLLLPLTETTTSVGQLERAVGVERLVGVQLAGRVQDDLPARGVLGVGQQSGTPRRRRVEEDQEVVVR